MIAVMQSGMNLTGYGNNGWDCDRGDPFGARHRNGNRHLGAISGHQHRHRSGHFCRKQNMNVLSIALAPVQSQYMALNKQFSENHLKLYNSV